MYRFVRQLLVSSLCSTVLLFSSGAFADYDGFWEEQREDWRQDQRQEERREDRREDRRQDAWNDRHKPNYVVVPRRRTVNNIIVVRPHGHPYPGYGYYHNDNEAYKWLAFTAITLKILDNINEAAQRAHEAAQVKATTAPVGEKIIWDEGDSSGYVVATKEGKSADSGLTCREYQQSITVGGNTEEAYGTACLQADGAWKIVE